MKKGVVGVFFVFSVATVLLLASFLSCRFLLTMTEGGIEDDYLVEDFEGADFNGYSFLVAESFLFAEKDQERLEKCDAFKELSPMDVDFFSIKESLEEIFFDVVEEDVSRARLTTVREDGIISQGVEKELALHTVESVGDESVFDFYVGTHDSGYLVGGKTGEGRHETEVVGQLDDRIRDIEVADVTGNDMNEVMVVTHHNGKTAIFYPQEDWDVEVLDSREYGQNETINHEVQAADLNNNGRKEIVSTPSEPNTFEEEQNGVIRVFERSGEAWEKYSTEELEKSHIRKIELCPEGNAIFGGVTQRDEPYTRDASIIKYEFSDDGFEKVNETFFPEARRNFYPFLVRGEEDLVVGVSSNGYAGAVDAETMEKEFTEEFSHSFEAFYTAEVFDYTGDGKDELALVHDGALTIYSVSSDGLQKVEEVKVYDDFDSTIIWGLLAFKEE